MRISVSAALSLAIVGSLLGGPAVAQVNDLKPLLVVDATGKVVGRLGGGHDGSEGVVMIVNANRIDVAIDIAGSDISGRLLTGLAWAPGAPVIFESSDCTGPAYIDAISNLRHVGFGTLPATVIESSPANYDLYVSQSIKTKYVGGPWHSLLSWAGCSAVDTRGPRDVWVLRSPVKLSEEFALPLFVK